MSAAQRLERPDSSLAEPMPGVDMAYMIWEVGTTNYKIGHSRNPTQDLRREQLELGLYSGRSSVRLELLATAPGGQTFQQLLQAPFLTRRKAFASDWFELTPDEARAVTVQIWQLRQRLRKMAMSVIDAEPERSVGIKRTEMLKALLDPEIPELKAVSRRAKRRSRPPPDYSLTISYLSSPGPETSDPTFEVMRRLGVLSRRA